MVEKRYGKLIHLYPRDLAAYEAMRGEGYNVSAVVRKLIVEFAEKRGLLPPEKGDTAGVAKKGNVSDINGGTKN